ncbi:hypothetical protein CNYM01_10797 [Colletotrichum nymphaeae SA-01]|uniref:Uncharacterized protein n=1 Tax=Colletotrichum nymphaeae SA-01 TaxID=1460502 RepID=A0A135SKA3_9PEZI|nr:hypothetical protein CNYM01_10797 [Colletotrichum nymphaeae SA-01]
MASTSFLRNFNDKRPRNSFKLRLPGTAFSSLALESTADLRTFTTPEPTEANMPHESCHTSGMLGARTGHRSSHLPVEILLRIAPHLESGYESSDLADWQRGLELIARRNLSNFCLVGRAWRAVGQVSLFRHYRATKTLPMFVRSLIECPDLGELVDSVSLDSFSYERFRGYQEATIMLKKRSKELGIEFPRDEDRTTLPQWIVTSNEVQSFLATMLLAHTPRAKHVKLPVQWSGEVLRNLVAAGNGSTMPSPQNPRTGFKDLVHLTLGKPDSPGGGGREFLHDTSEYWCALQLAPNLTSLALFDFFPIKSTLEPSLQKLFTNLTSLRIGGSLRNTQSFVDHFESVSRVCRFLEEIQIILPQHPGQLENLLDLLQPFAATLKRLRLSIDIGTMPIEHPLWRWDGLNLLQKLTCLDTLRLDFNHDLCRDHVTPFPHEPVRTEEFFDSLPTSLRTLFLPGCNWAIRNSMDYRIRREYHTMERLVTRIRRGDLPELRTLHIACSRRASSPFFGQLEDLGVEVVHYKHHATLCGGDLAALDVENWKLL